MEEKDAVQIAREAEELEAIKEPAVANSDRQEGVSEEVYRKIKEVNDTDAPGEGEGLDPDEEGEGLDPDEYKDQGADNEPVATNRKRATKRHINRPKQDGEEEPKAKEEKNTVTVAALDPSAQALDPSAADSALAEQSSGITVSGVNKPVSPQDHARAWEEYLHTVEEIDAKSPSQKNEENKNRRAAKFGALEKFHKDIGCEKDYECHKQAGGDKIFGDKASADYVEQAKDAQGNLSLNVGNKFTGVVTIPQESADGKRENGYIEVEYRNGAIVHLDAQPQPVQGWAAGQFTELVAKAQMQGQENGPDSQGLHDDAARLCNKDKALGTAVSATIVTVKSAAKDMPPDQAAEAIKESLKRHGGHEQHASPSGQLQPSVTPVAGAAKSASRGAI